MRAGGAGMTESGVTQSVSTDYRDGSMMTDKKKFLLRMDHDLWNELEAWAADERRSVNGQIEYVLRQAVEKRQPNGRGG